MSLAYEWPLKFVAGSAIHKSMELRMLWLPLVSLTSVLMYQSTNPALYYLIGTVGYFWAYGEGEVSAVYVESMLEDANEDAGCVRCTLDSTEAG